MLSILLSLKNRPDRQQKLAQFYETYGGQMLYLARSILRHPEEAEDAVQDAAFLRAGLLGRDVTWMCWKRFPTPRISATIS